MDDKHIGSSLEDFLRTEGRLEEARQVAAKRVLAWQLQQAMEWATFAPAAPSADPGRGGV